MSQKKKGYLETAGKGEVIILRILLIILGLMLLLMGLYFIVLIPLAILSFYLSHKCSKELKRRKSVVVVAETPVKEPESPYIFLRFKVTGVTYKNGRKTRQAILRAFKWGDEIPETVDFELYEYEGRPAVYVKINDQIVGNVPADTTETFLEHEKLYQRDNVHCDIYGGSKLDDGSRTNYGCEIIIRYLKERG